MLVRLKEIPIDDCGTVVRIGGHTFAQIEQFAAARTSDNSPEAQLATARAVRQFVADALNNAGPSEPWTEARINQEMDQVTFAAIFNAALAHDGLKVATGETAAA